LRPSPGGGAAYAGCALTIDPCTRALPQLPRRAGAIRPWYKVGTLSDRRLSLSHVLRTLPVA